MKFFKHIFFTSLCFASIAHGATTTTEALSISISPDLTVTYLVGSDTTNIYTEEKRESFSMPLNGYSGPGKLVSAEFYYEAWSEITFTQSYNSDAVYVPGDSNKYYVEQNIQLLSPFSYSDLPWDNGFYAEYPFDSHNTSGTLLAPVFLAWGNIDDIDALSMPWTLEGDIFSLGSIDPASTSGTSSIHFNNLTLSLTVTYHAEELRPIPIPGAIWLLGSSIVSLSLTNKARRCIIRQIPSSI